MHKSVSTLHIVLICALQFADFLRLCLSPQTTHAQSPFLCPVVFGINLIPFLIRYSLSTRCPLLGYALLYLCHYGVATVAVCGFGSWALAFHCGLPCQISPPTRSQTEASVCSTMEESTRSSSFYSLTLSANKHVIQICRYSLSAAADLADG